MQQKKLILTLTDLDLDSTSATVCFLSLNNRIKIRWKEIMIHGPTSLYITVAGSHVLPRLQHLQCRAGDVAVWLQHWGHQRPRAGR